MAKENKTPYVLLGFLNHEPLSGYELKKRIEGSIGYFWDAGFGQIYPALKEMEAVGDISGVVTASEQGPERTIYSINPQGRQKLNSWLSKSADGEKLRFELLLKLFFSAGGDRTAIIREIRIFQKRSEENLRIFSAYRESLAPVLAESPDHINYHLTIRFGEWVTEAYIKWCKEALDSLEPLVNENNNINKETPQ